VTSFTTHFKLRSSGPASLYIQSTTAYHTNFTQPEFTDVAG